MPWFRRPRSFQRLQRSILILPYAIPAFLSLLVWRGLLNDDFGVVNAILSPFAASSTPGTPADAPSMWALLAFARREFDRAFTAPSLTESPVDAQTTSETRTLILSAFPAEADAILARTTLDPNPTVVVDGHRFYLVVCPPNNW